MVTQFEEANGAERPADLSEKSNHEERSEVSQEHPPSYEESERADSETETHFDTSGSTADNSDTIHQPFDSEFCSTPIEAFLESPSSRSNPFLNTAIAVTNAINNIPCLYGDTHVTPPPQITGITSGLKQGTKALAYGFGSGFTGIVTQALRDGRKDGVVGFAKGLIRGSLGVVVKPTIAAVSFVGCTTRGFYHEFETKNGKPREGRYDIGLSASSGTLGASHDESGSFLAPKQDTSSLRRLGPGNKHSDTRSRLFVDELAVDKESSHRASTASSLPGRFIRDSVAQMTDQRYSGVIEQGLMAVGMIGSRQITVERPDRKGSN
ncbi:hypothetical protein E4T38_06353 [Aureobasidium subglaciale]|nr:hypothetical protein E4T38_06353 [Aureobasidium subglaciale]KAI5219531.1 hypothetical protein E4T40_06395 [Aureobasidium subglaciale]KAI5223202.1 hypothetical protein E4T41_06235 [Aureobasidium subglaciale]KAI5259742.1 hypothetical protein E4T46_06670 [Aureobasidium subglaciale]